MLKNSLNGLTILLTIVTSIFKARSTDKSLVYPWVLVVLHILPIYSSTNMNTTTSMHLYEIRTSKLRHLSRMFRYQDDCIVFNDEDDFNNHFIPMYPSEMLLKCTNISPAKSTFLDLTISVYRGKYR